MATVYRTVLLQCSTDVNIRLVKLHPDLASIVDSSEPFISCELQTISLDSSVPFRAVSYVRGSPDMTRTILLNGQPFTVRKNLWDLLNQTRLAPDVCAGFLWIDALCIDQTNIGERNHQVALMGKIYSNAMEVVVWLGLGSKKTDLAIFKLSHHFRCLADIDIVLGVQELLLVEYWKRTWIVQEFILAKCLRIWCGDKEISDTLARLSAIVNSSYAVMPFPGSNDREWMRAQAIAASGCMALTHRRASWHHSAQRSERPPFCFLMRQINNNHCSDARDRVYALLSLADPLDLDKFPIIPDYSEPVHVLFEKLVVRFCAQLGQKGILKEPYLRSHAKNLEETLGLSRQDECVKKTYAKLPSMVESQLQFSGPQRKSVDFDVWVSKPVWDIYH